jgi:hypothetical protein
MAIAFADNYIAHELASRLNRALGPCTWVAQFIEGGWKSAPTSTNPNALHPLIANAIHQSELRAGGPLIARQDGQLIVLQRMDAYDPVPIIVGIVLPDQNEQVICSLISGHREAIQSNIELAVAKHESELFIDQVTQDFEELTWLRTANEYFDLCGSKHTVESIACKCLPDLASVIRAESIIFVHAIGAPAIPTARPDWNRVITTGSGQRYVDTYTRFLEDSIPQLASGPRVLNIKPNEVHLAGYPGMKNCIALEVSKGLHVYGWILAINRAQVQNDLPTHEAVSVLAPVCSIARTFGTFEAGLLSAAANIMSSHARNLELFEAQESLLTGVVRAIINAIDAKDPYTCGHSDRVALYAKHIAARLGESTEECERIYMAGLLHDVGKIGVPDYILAKPGPLSIEEFAIVKKHPEIGHTILQHLKQLDYVLPGVLHHHEAVNGSGYPHGLAGEAIPLHGRILAVADAYDAMTSDRPYRAGMPSEQAESILRAEAGRLWDSDIVSLFLECLANDEIHPHCLEPTLQSHPVLSEPNSNNSLMRRIANSINSLVVE